MYVEVKLYTKDVCVCVCALHTENIGTNENTKTCAYSYRII